MNALTAAAVAVAVLLVLLVRRSGAREPSPFERALVPRPPTPAPPPPDSLVAARRLVLHARTPGGLHFRVRPRLVELTEARLRDRHGVGLDDPRAATLVAEPLWSLVRPDAPEPRNRTVPRVPPARLHALLDALEAL